MQLLSNCKDRPCWQKLLNLKTLLAMKMLVILLTAASLQIAARGYSQSITLSLKNARLEKVFKELEKQTDFSFIYSEETMARSHPVTVEVKNETVENILK